MARRSGAAAMSPPSSDADDRLDDTMPERIRLTKPRGFVDEGGHRHHWRQGQTVSDPETIVLLLSRGVHHVAE